MKSAAETLAGMRTRVLRQELDRELREADLRRVLEPPNGGWIKTLRSALNMTARQLARRLNITQGAVAQAEQAELDGGITLRHLRKYAAALDCDLVYGLVPRADLDMIMHIQGGKAAQHLVAETDQAMALEGQAVDPGTRASQLDALRTKLIAEGSKRIWDW